MMNQPTAVPVKKEIVAAEEAARNNVDLLVAESQRFERLINSQKRELAALDGSLTDMKQQVMHATNNHDAVLATSKELERKVESLTHDINILSGIIEATKAEIAVREDELSGREADITTAEKMLQEAEIAFRERSSNLAEDEAVLRDKKIILSEALLKL